MYLLDFTTGESVLRDLVVALLTCLVATFAASRLRIPSVVGLLVAGVVIGPGGIGLISAGSNTETLANIGIVFLLFAIGLQFPVAELKGMKRAVFGGGGLQVLLTTLVLAFPLSLLGEWIGLTTGQAIFAGLLLSQSSTAVMMKVLEQRGESGSAAGRIAVAVSIFQDVSSIAVILFIPVMAGVGGSVLEIFGMVGKSVLAIVVVFVLARILLPKFFDAVVRTRSTEVFSFATIAVILGVAFFSGLLGLSLALGAFMAGIVVAESDVARQVLADIRLLRDNLMGLFFVSVGLLLRPQLLVEQGALLLGIAVAAVALKAAVMVSVGIGLGFGIRTSVTAGILVAQIGEFSFVLAQVAREYRLLPEGTYESFVAVAILSMVLMPGVLRFADPISTWLEKRRFLRRIRRNRIDRGLASLPSEYDSSQDDRPCVLVIGYGVTGRNIHRMLGDMPTREVIIETNPHTVRRERERGLRIFYGDACRPEVLLHAGIRSAVAVAVTVPDPAAAEAIVYQCRQLNPDAGIIVRTRFTREIEPLKALGATHVIPEEVETSLELGGRMMAMLGASAWAVAEQKHQIRRDQYHLLLDADPATPARSSVAPLSSLAGAEVAAIRLGEDAKGAGKTLKDLDLRASTGASVFAVVRGHEVIRGPGADFRFAIEDVVYLLGSHEEVEAAEHLIGCTPPVTKPSDDELLDLGARNTKRLHTAE